MESLLLLADSGGTKTAWRSLQKDGLIRDFETAGFNPYIQASTELRNDIASNLLSHREIRPDKIFFYGSGCSNQANKNLVLSALKNCFPESEIHVEHDLMAAARALCGSTPGIVCILGTGSNSCLYDGTSIIENIPSLGYVLGDEGSGQHVGKKLLADFLRGDMPRDISASLAKRFDLNKDIILDRTYNQAQPSRFLASFAHFVRENSNNDYLRRLVLDALREFFRLNIVKYTNYKNYTLHCTGGFAIGFEQNLREVAAEFDLEIASVVKNPMDGLTLFHKRALNLI